jgi:hypothetical protein
MARLHGQLLCADTRYRHRPGGFAPLRPPGFSAFSRGQGGRGRPPSVGRRNTSLPSFRASGLNERPEGTTQQRGRCTRTRTRLAAPHFLRLLRPAVVRHTTTGTGSVCSDRWQPPKPPERIRLAPLPLAYSAGLSLTQALLRAHLPAMAQGGAVRLRLTGQRDPLQQSHSGHAMPISTGRRRRAPI